MKKVSKYPKVSTLKPGDTIRIIHRFGEEDFLTENKTYIVSQTSIEKNVVILSIPSVGILNWHAPANNWLHLFELIIPEIEPTSDTIIEQLDELSEKINMGPIKYWFKKLIKKLKR